MNSTECSRCQKTSELCVCEFIRPMETRIHVLILQHPQEPDKELGSARIAHLALPNSTLKIGLSWPNIRKVLGREVQPSKWAVLYLGSGIKGKVEKPQPLQLVDRKGAALTVPLKQAAQELEGIVVLDGTWSQAKALWWRNAWLLKLKRAVLTSNRRSLYRELRKEPRGECLSTIESIAEALEALGEPAQTSEALREVFSKLLDNKRKLRRAARPPKEPSA